MDQQPSTSLGLGPVFWPYSSSDTSLIGCNRQEAAGCLLLRAPWARPAQGTHSFDSPTILISTSKSSSSSSDPGSGLAAASTALAADRNVSPLQRSTRAPMSQSASSTSRWYSLAWITLWQRLSKSRNCSGVTHSRRQGPRVPPRWKQMSRTRIPGLLESSRRDTPRTPAVAAARRPEEHEDWDTDEPEEDEEQDVRDERAPATLPSRACAASSVPRG
mmetsp:Transcript_93060/g.249688  ORF Transcript_93060/g.249688 Transcript_93060/m.249688 type:complete len:218 (-) Transcript_93060:42-695(-)